MEDKIVVNMAALRFHSTTCTTSVVYLGLNLIQLFSLGYTKRVYERLVYEDSA
jgi:hypothetical protein